MVFSILGTYKVRYQPDDSYPVREIDFTPPFRRINMIEGLEAATKVNFPADLTTAATNDFLSSLAEQYNINCPAPRTTARLLDKLVGHFLEDGIVSPTFICEHPEIMSPLAKTHRTKHGLTERFELFVCEKELCNAYTRTQQPAGAEREIRIAEQRQGGGGTTKRNNWTKSQTTLTHSHTYTATHEQAARDATATSSLIGSLVCLCSVSASRWTTDCLPPPAGEWESTDSPWFLSNVDNIKVTTHTHTYTANITKQLNSEQRGVWEEGK